MTRGARAIFELLIVAAVVELALLHGCGQGGTGGGSGGSGNGVSLPPPAVPLLGLSANPETVVVSASAGGTSDLTAQLADPNTHLPLAGIPVSFFASGGKLASATAASDHNGIATDSLNVAAGAPDSSLTVSAHAHGGGQSLSLAVANLAVIALSASPSFLACSGGNPGLGVVQALALDSGNNPLANVRIAFAASSGGTVSPLATTDANGEASASVSAPAGLPSASVQINAEAAGVGASIALPVSGCAGLSPSPTPTPGNGIPSVLEFLSAIPAQLGVLQSGKAQQSTLTFKLTDSQGGPVGGITVDFFISSLGGEAIAPPSAVTAGDGTVQTVLTSGKRATVVQVTATAGSIVAISTPVTIVGGPPVQGRLSASAQFQNIAGNAAGESGLIDPLTVALSDGFSNPVPPGTAISLQSVGGAVGVPSTTDANGIATGNLIAEAPTNPTDLNGVPTGGIVTVLAFTRGETPFIDLNGNGVWDPGEPVIAVPEPFFDLNGNGVRDANEPFIDLNGNGKYDLDQSGGLFSQNVVVFTSTRVTFSGPTVLMVSPPTGFTIPNGGSQSFALTLTDGFGNPLVAGSSYKIVSAPGGTVQGGSGTAPDGESFGQLIEGLNQFTFTVNDSDSVNNPVPITVTITVTSPGSTTAPGGNGNTSIQLNGTMN